VRSVSVLVAAFYSRSTILLSEVPQHCKKRQTKHVNVLKKAARTRKTVIPSPISSMARSTIVLIITATALMVTVSA
jgi:hypothetical protein